MQIQTALASNPPRHAVDVGPKPFEITPEFFIARSSWRFADTMADMPHEYTVKETGDGRGTALSGESFEWFVALIRERGELGSYRNLQPNLRLVIGPYYYWTMGAPVTETTIVNRALLVDHDKTLAETRAIARRRAKRFLASAGA
ncbi:MAG: hypothetical protein JHD02_03695 [Thermoleophilaceae bacterium]|nr:hypothetical protein [Thermoleophilaceae bacterium]